MGKLVKLSAIAFLVQGVVGCDSGEDDTAPEVDTDTDSDADTDSDVDTGLADADGDGWTVTEGDCDDASTSVHPQATEVVADGVDQDCDDGDTCYQDADEDGFGASGTVTSADLDCADPGESSETGDCDDGDAAVHPGATEDCGDGVDQDCDGGDASCRYTGTFDLESPGVVELAGEGIYDVAGFSVSGAGDLDADGFADILVGAQGDETGGTLAGAAYLLYGPVTADRNLSLADVKLTGEHSADHAGAATSRAGDVNGDGFGDILVGAYGDGDGGNQAGAAYLLYGPVEAGGGLSLVGVKLVGEDASDLAGGSVSGAGDVNDDGFADLLIGAQGRNDRRGAAYLVHGPVTTDLDLALADARLLGEETADEAGNVLSGAGDVDGDGFADILIAAPRNDEGGDGAGAAYLLVGPIAGDRDLSTADAKLVGEDVQDWAGWSVASAGDVDNDGYDDILVGADGDDDGGSYAGAAYLVCGPVTTDLDLSLADAKFIGEEADDIAGTVSGAGDVDGDGFSDILIGAFRSDAGDVDAGAAYLVYGPVTGYRDLSLSDVRFTGEEADGWAGYSVSGAGDVDGDGLADILVGSPRSGDGPYDPAIGAAFLVLTAKML
jgi:hypothetical protein